MAGQPQAFLQVFLDTFLALYTIPKVLIRRVFNNDELLKLVIISFILVNLNV